MKLHDLLEAVRRDVFGQLQNTRVLTDEQTGKNIYLDLSRHLEDERENGEARGDHAKPKELKSAIRVGLKKLIDEHGLEKLLIDDVDNRIAIKFKTKSQKVLVPEGSTKRIRLDSYIIIIGRLLVTPKMKLIKFKIITIFPPTGETEPEHDRTDVRFKALVSN